MLHFDDENYDKKFCKEVKIFQNKYLNCMKWNGEEVYRAVFWTRERRTHFIVNKFLLADIKIIKYIFLQKYQKLLPDMNTA